MSLAAPSSHVSSYSSRRAVVSGDSHRWILPVTHHCFHQNGCLVLVCIRTDCDLSSSVRVAQTITPIFACFFTTNSPVSMVFAYSFHQAVSEYSSWCLTHRHACTNEFRWNVSELLAILSSFLICENLIEGANIKSFRIVSWSWWSCFIILV
jgi:hypothetical protein